ncbi:MAG: hypothetical protein IPL06_15075 [Betaproteobacteria bacterium]|nr:hypothetical protein [Betaproteobacteria bacterium]
MRPRPRASLAVALALLAASLLPAFATVLGPGTTATKQVEICSVAGPVVIEVPAHGPGIPIAPKASDFDKDPCCPTGGTPSVILPTPPLMPYVAGRSDAPPCLAGSVAIVSRDWPAALARAPPSRS